MDQEEYHNQRMVGLVYNLIGNLGMYSSALWGLSAILQDNLEMDKVGYAGITFGAAGAIKYLSTLVVSRSDGDLVRESITAINLAEVERRLGEIDIALGKDK